MTHDSQQDTYISSQIAQVIHDFMRLKTQFKTLFPKDLSELKNRLAEVSPRSGELCCANYELFYRVSSILYPRNSLTMGELSSALSVPLSTATWMVDWMVDNAYVSRMPDLEDRRVVRVTLTDNGRQLHESTEKYMMDRAYQILSGLTTEEKTMLFLLLRKVAATLKNMPI